MSPDAALEGRGGRAAARVGRGAVGAALALALLGSLAERARAGCAVPEPALWSPLGARPAPVNSKVVVTLGGLAGLVRSVELRVAGGGARVAVQQRALAGPRGHTLLELTPEVALTADTTYELVARRPHGWHPSQWVFGALTTSRDRDEVAPELRVLGGRLFRSSGANSARVWGELDVMLKDGEVAGGAALYAVWLPDASGALDTSRPPDAYVPGEGHVLHLSSPVQECPDLVLSLPPSRTRLELGLAALDAAGNRSAPQRVSLEASPPPANEGG